MTWQDEFALMQLTAISNEMVRFGKHFVSCVHADSMRWPPGLILMHQLLPAMPLPLCSLAPGEKFRQGGRCHSLLREHQS